MKHDEPKRAQRHIDAVAIKAPEIYVSEITSDSFHFCNGQLPEQMGASAITNVTYNLLAKHVCLLKSFRAFS